MMDSLRSLLNMRKKLIFVHPVVFFYPKRRGYVKLHALKSAVHLKFVQIRNSGDGLSTMAAWRVGMRIDGEIRRAGANLRGMPTCMGIA